MSAFFSFFQPGFLLHNALWGSIVVGLFCPLIGVYFMLRRMTLLGIALPQISAVGVAFAFFLQGFGISWSLHPGEFNDRFLALLGSFIFGFIALLILAWLERRREGTAESRIGAAYAMAFAAAILLVSANASGKIEMLSMLNGEIVSVSSPDLHLLLIAYGVLTVLLILFNRQFLSVSYDRDAAQVLGMRVMAWDIALFAVMGISISMGVLIVGPMLTFAFLSIPPLAARRFCKRMWSFFLLSSLFGGASGLIGFLLSYQLDWPLGPTDIAVAFCFLLLAVGVRKTISVFSS
jgi:ABC-type Mn2+/Zn2+ transport system permease subunit